ncbi:lipase [Histoplasma capsulatum var. duboisii H88]|uniref:Lipase n=1 Tax=Ajellomyces capsulatus (strain H88) TaxID=544711 RepID=A0A8A1LDY2_AJEC8|nr:lipase [Histoplasma capsulatum var. duboisii H88]
MCLQGWIRYQLFDYERSPFTAPRIFYELAAYLLSAYLKNCFLLMLQMPWILHRDRTSMRQSLATQDARASQTF